LFFACLPMHLHSIPMALSIVVDFFFRIILHRWVSRIVLNKSLRLSCILFILNARPLDYLTLSMLLQDIISRHLRM
jgi:hypothetical protein